MTNAELHTQSAKRNPRDIVTDDFCRRCGGKGGAYEPTERGTKIFEPCFACRGTGKQTVRVGE